MNIDEETARRIFDTYSNYVYQTAYFLTGSRGLAEDVAQESLLRVYRSYSNYNPDKPLKPWIYRIVVNAARTALKQQSRQKTVPLEREFEAADRDSITQVVAGENQAEILAALERISLKSKEVIVLRFFEELSLAEIAEVLSIPLGTCKSRLNTAMHQLRKHLPPEIASQYEGGEGIEKP